MSRAPEMLILLDDSQIDKYGEDVFAFKTDADKCFKYLSKLRGKRREFTDMSALFNEMLEQDFPELFPIPPPGIIYDTSQESGRKRSRSSMSSVHDMVAAEVRPEKKTVRVSDSSMSIVKKEDATTAVRTTLAPKVKVFANNINNIYK